MLALLLLIFLSLPSYSALLGIDFGSDLVKLSVVSHGHSFDIVLDGSSKRKHLAMVGFDDGERRFGNEAASLQTKKPNLAFRFLKRLLGKSAESPMVDDFKRKYFPYEFVADGDRGTVRVKVGDKSLSMEEIVSMSLQYARKIAGDYIGDTTGEIRDCVLTVPDFFSTKERQALIDAAELAGLNVLSLINENSAVALYYGIEKDYFLDKHEHIIFYNMGSSSTQVSVVKYSAWLKMISRKKNKTIGQVEVLSQAWDESLGGSSFDFVLVEHLRQTAEKQFGKTLSGDFRIMARLRKAAEKAKYVLSANKETSVRITSLMDDEDLKTVITRDNFLRLSKTLLQRVLTPVEVALERAGLEKEDIEAIVLMGGGTRIPKIQEILTDFLGKELRKDLNTDEAATMGAVFRAANMSTTFRVRQIGLKDRIQYAVGASILNYADWKAIQDGEKTADSLSFAKRASIFEANGFLKRRKSVSLFHDEDLFVSVHYTNPSLLPTGTSPAIRIYKIGGVRDAIGKFKDQAPNKPKIVIAFVHDSSGIAGVQRASATFTVEKDGKEVKEKVPLTVESLGTDLKSLTKRDMAASAKLLREYDNIDKEIRARARAYNNLEAYILESRSPIMSDDDWIRKVSTDEEREKLSGILESAEDWMFDGEERSRKELVDRLSDLKDAVDPVLTRRRELKIRKESVSNLREDTSGLKKTLENLKFTKKWIPTEDIDTIVKKIADWEQWLKEKNKEQKKRDPKLEPLFLIEDLEKVVQGFGEDVRTISKRPEPPKKKTTEKKKKKKQKKKKAAGEEDKNESSNDVSEEDEKEEL